VTVTVTVPVPVLERCAIYGDATVTLAASSHHPVHAYLLAGRASSTTELGRAFAAALLCPNGGDGTCRVCQLALAGAHVDQIEVERVGAAITVDQADQVIHAAVRSPVESPRKVITIREAHLMRAEAAAKLLKTVEEPPPTTVFVIEAEAIPPELVTIRSRCVVITVPPLSPGVVAARLVEEGIEPDVADAAARAAGDDLSRARLLATDPGLAARRQRFATIPDRLDGTGSTAAVEVDVLLAAIDTAAAPLKERQAGELERFEGRGRKELEDRHRRELRRHRTQELQAGLGALGATYRERLVAGGDRRDAEAVAAVHDAIEALTLNPNEPLLLQALLLGLRRR
jgi:DNA polymerase III subunit delta'